MDGVTNALLDHFIPVQTILLQFSVLYGSFLLLLYKCLMIIYCQPAEITWGADRFPCWKIFLDQQIFWSAGPWPRLLYFRHARITDISVTFHKLITIIQKYSMKYFGILCVVTTNSAWWTNIHQFPSVQQMIDTVFVIFFVCYFCYIGNSTCFALNDCGNK